jgi:hypothetical protein
MGASARRLYISHASDGGWLDMRMRIALNYVGPSPTEMKTKQSAHGINSSSRLRVGVSKLFTPVARKPFTSRHCAV